MKRFLWNCKGAVTVFVTLMLIPAILVTGTGVDMGRIYAARGLARNGNQLALNATLASYDSLLQDMYGLFAVMKANDDPALNEMLDLHIRATFFNEKVSFEQISNFGALLRATSGNPMFAVEGFDPLSAERVLARQIQEYAKWRAPIIIITDIINRIQNNSQQVVDDSAATNEYMQLGEDLADVGDDFSAMIEEIEMIESLVDDLFLQLNNHFKLIRAQFEYMRTIRAKWQTGLGTVEERDALEDEYYAEMDVVSGLVNDLRSYVDGTAKPLFNNFGSRFGTLIGIAQRIEGKMATARVSADKLRARLNNPADNMSDEVREGIKEDLKDIDELLKHNMLDLVQKWRDKAVNHTNSVILPMLNSLQAYGSINSSNDVIYPMRSFTFLLSLASNNQANGFDIYYNMPRFPGGPPMFPEDLNGLNQLAQSSGEFTSSFPTFRESGTDFDAVFAALARLSKAHEGQKAEEERARLGCARRILRQARDIFAGWCHSVTHTLCLCKGGKPTNGIGAPEYLNSNRPTAYRHSPGPSFNLALGVFTGPDNERGFIQNMKVVLALLTGDLTINDILGSMLSDAINRGIMVTYAGQVFSNWTTLHEKSTKTTMTGYDITPVNNFFYLSEMEYLFNGSQAATVNLLAVTTTILAIRIVANFASSFIIKEVNAEIKAVSSSLGLIPIVGWIIKPLIRPFYVFVESVIDVAELRNGKNVALLKINKDNWNFWFGGLADCLLGSFDSTDSDDSRPASWLYYRDYLTIFLLAADPDTLTRRIGNLIMLNMTNQRLPANLRGSDRTNAMAQQTDQFDFAFAYTSFKGTTTADVNLLFLTLPQALGQGATRQVVEISYRGY